MTQLANPASILGADYFELFNLPRAFAIDLERLDRDYHALQHRFHPDRFSGAGEFDRRRALEISTHINSGYLTLRHSLSRARYLLALVAAAVSAENRTPMPPAFLMRQMELRESMEASRGNVAALHRIKEQLRQESLTYERNLARLLDDTRDFEGAAECVRMLGFYDSLRRDADRMIEAAEEIHAV